MSGCVNCVWEVFRGELEEYAAVKKRAEAAAAASGENKEEETVVGMQQKKGKEGEGIVDGDLFRGVPVGMLEFIKQEKRLKERRVRRGLGDVST